MVVMEHQKELCGTCRSLIDRKFRRGSRCSWRHRIGCPWNGLWIWNANRIYR